MPFPFKSPTPHPHPPPSANTNTNTARPHRSNLIPPSHFVPEPCGPPFISPWPSARASSPTTQLRRSFRNFVSSENYARRERNETAFASGEQRDRAFEKLMRLSRGEEEIGWEIAQVPRWEWEELEGWEGWEVERRVFVEEVKEDKDGVGDMEIVGDKMEEGDEDMKDVDENKVDVEDIEMKDDDDWEDISNWQTAVRSQASGSTSSTTQHKSNNKGKGKADHSRKDSKECAVYDNVKQNVVKVDKGRGNSVTYIEDVSKLDQNVMEIQKGRGNSVTYIEDVSKVTQDGAGNWMQHW